ncbi:hypothetical protein ACPV3A_37070 [Paenibacillus sp. Dod16]|uniref:hypothetical protein n=1 Tax=Paenibacillus sp. Dod16 TaxID=3416392 RepID=UPI003CEA6458
MIVIVKVSMKSELIPSGKACGWANLNTDSVALIQSNLLQNISHGYTEAVAEFGHFPFHLNHPVHYMLKHRENVRNRSD